MSKRAGEFLGRQDELRRLSDFLQAPGSGFLHLRGRRRVGKSWLLLELQRRRGGLYFQGEQDSTTKQLQATLAALWDGYVGHQSLSLFRRYDLTWERIFAAITTQARQHPARTIVLIFDEIHWIAKRNSGFSSKIKRAWLAWEKTGNIKVIICGSSNRFFDDRTAKASSVLRGLRTHADVWVRPFSLRETQRYFFPKWSPEEICLAYMMVGGVPYYLSQFTDTKNFIHAVNQVFFLRSTIFLDELDEVINLEFNRSSKTRVRRILAALGQAGKTIAAVRRVTGFPESSVRETIAKLVDYGLVFEKTAIGGAGKKNRSGVRYYLRDFYLNFYFQVLAGWRTQIENNSGTNLFSGLLGSKLGFYLPGFSGLAFELLLESVIDRRANRTMSETIFKKLKIMGEDYVWGHYWQPGSTQVDLVVVSPADRESRVIEAKWIAQRPEVTRGYLEQVQQKAYMPPRGFRLSFYLAMSKPPTKGLREAAEQQDIKILELKDLF